MPELRLFVIRKDRKITLVAGNPLGYSRITRQNAGDTCRVEPP
jgi:hypothetical protein